MTIEELLDNEMLRRLVVNSAVAMKWQNPEIYNEERLRAWCFSRGEALMNHYIHGTLDLTVAEMCLDIAHGITHTWDHVTDD